MASRRPHKPEIAGPNPACATIFIKEVMTKRKKDKQKINIIQGVLMTLNRESLLKSMELKKETLEIEGGTVIVSEIGATDLIDLYTRKELHDADGNIIMAKFTPALVAMSVVDDAGRRIFADADIPLLEKSAASQLSKLAQAARRLNGLLGDETKN
jgi:hypothetical protein